VAPGIAPILVEAHLEGADLYQAYLEGAFLTLAHLEGATLTRADLEGARLIGAHLEGARLSEAYLEGASFTGATLDGKTDLSDAIIFAPADPRSLHARLLRRPRYGPALGDIHWGDFDLVQLTQWEGWDAVRRLADEQSVDWLSEAEAYEYRAAVRAYRQMAQRLRDQGFSDVADRLSDRAQVLQRKLLFHVMLEDWRRPWLLPGDLLRWLFSWFLALLAGYGYHPGRTLLWYLVLVAGFAVTYFAYGTGCPILGVSDIVHVLSTSQVCTAHPMTWHEAFVVSFTAFHGRGFFVGTFEPSDPQATVAAVEAVTGLLVEISFIATFTQRFFAR
jgi:hypothetical protein